MPCTVVKVGDATAIVCTRGRRQRVHACVRCGRPADRLCDWKVAIGGTCDTPICSTCTYSPKPGKDLCPQHANQWTEQQRQKELGL